MKNDIMDRDWSSLEFSDFHEDIRALQRGVIIMWVINTIFLSFVYTAILIVALMSTGNTVSGVINELIAYYIIGAVGAVITVAIVSLNAKKMILGSIEEGKQEITQGPLWDIVDEVKIGSGMTDKDIRVFISDENVLNAYALGDNNGNGYIVFTRHLLDALDRDEVTAVAAHEIAHIYTKDSVAMTKLIAMSSIVGLISSVALRGIIYGGGRKRSSNNNSNGGNILAIAMIILSLVFLALAPVISSIGNAFMSRQRESRADAFAVKFTRHPTALATALLKINNISVDAANRSSEAKNDMKDFHNKVGAMAFSNPTFLKRAFSTHPSLDKRIEALVRQGAVINDLNSNDTDLHIDQ